MQQQPHRYCMYCGSALVAASCPQCGPARPSSVPPAPGPAPVPLRRAPRTPAGTRRLWPAVLITAVVGVVLLCTATVRLVPRFIGPEAAVRAYFAALADRDATRARGLLADGSAIGQRGPIAGVDERADLSLLTDGTLHDTGYTPPRNLTIVRTTWTGTSATVEASYDFGGPPSTITLPLVDENGMRGLPSWRITDGLLELVLASPVDGRLVVAGSSTPPMVGTGGLVAFPGAYRVALPEHPLYRAEPVIAFAGGGLTQPSPVQVHENARRDVEQQVRAQLDACARRIERAPSGCPFVASSSVPVKVLSWTIVRYPELNFTVAAGEVSVTSPAQGVAAATVVRASGAGASWQETVSFNISGTVRVVDGKAVLSDGR